MLGIESNCPSFPQLQTSPHTLSKWAWGGGELCFKGCCFLNWYQCHKNSIQSVNSFCLFYNYNNYVQGKADNIYEQNSSLKLSSSKMPCCVIGQIVPEVLTDNSAFSLRAKNCLSLQIKALWSFGNYLPCDTASHFRTLEPSATLCKQVVSDSTPCSWSRR
jgi:hypothetical protein